MTNQKLEWKNQLNKKNERKRENRRKTEGKLLPSLMGRPSLPRSEQSEE
jgi:hypothetical protein